MKTLDDLFDEVRELDSTDPICMDKVLEYLDELIAESDYFMEVLEEKLDNAPITWHQPWYQQTSRVGKVPVAEFSNNTTFLEGRLTQDECDRIDHNWRKLRKKFGLPNKLDCFARWKLRKGFKSMSRVRLFVTSYLAKGLERNLQQVYKHIVNHYGKSRRGPYTKDDKKIIDICLYHNPNKAVRIVSDVLSREPRRIYYKVHDAVNGINTKTKRIKWNLSLATKLLKLLMKVTGENFNGLKNKQISMDVWKNLEKDFETKAEYLRHFWYTTLHCQLYCKCDVTLKRVKRKVLKIFRRSAYRVWTDIKWKDVVAEFPDGFTFQFIYWISIRMFRLDGMHNKVPIDELVRIGLERVKKQMQNKRLKTLVLNEEGNLEVIRYDVKLSSSSSAH